MNKDMAQPNKSHMDSSSGLRSANDMSDPVPSSGYGAVEDIPGVGSTGGGAPVKSASEAGVSYGGPAGGAPIETGDKGEMPGLSTLMDVGEKPDSPTGAGLRSAVGNSPST